MSSIPHSAASPLAVDPKLLKALGPGASARSFPYFNIVGPGRDRALELDRKVRQLAPARDLTPDAEEYKRLLEAFIASPLTGCTTVLDQLRLEAKYNPLSPTTESIIKFFYMGIATHPLFTPPPPLQDSFHFRHGPEADSHLKEMMERFKGTDATARRMIEEQLRATLGLAVQSVGKAQESEVIAEYSLSVDSAISFSYLRCHIIVSVTLMPPYNYWYTVEGGKGWIQYQFNQAKWPELADGVLRKHLELADDWIKP